MPDLDGCTVRKSYSIVNIVNSHTHYVHSERTPVHIVQWKNKANSVQRTTCITTLTEVKQAKVNMYSG